MDLRKHLKYYYADDKDIGEVLCNIKKDLTILKNNFHDSEKLNEVDKILKNWRVRMYRGCG
jgi:hypothetical protein